MATLEHSPTKQLMHSWAEVAPNKEMLTVVGESLKPRHTLAAVGALGFEALGAGEQASSIKSFPSCSIWITLRLRADGAAAADVETSCEACWLPPSFVVAVTFSFCMRAARRKDRSRVRF